MGKIKIKDITIKYNKNSNINKIKKIITNNYSIIFEHLSQRKIISLIPTKKKEIDYVSNFDDFFYEIVLSEWNNEPEPLLKIGTYLSLISLILDKMNISQDVPIDVPDDEISFMISLFYFKKNGTINDLIEHLNNPTKTSEIIKWFINKMRYSIYEYLLNTQIDYLKSEDIEYLENLNIILLNLYEQNEQMKIDLKSYEFDEKQNLPNIPLEEIDKLFIEFLEYIKAPNEWLKLYQEIKNKNLINYVESTNSKSSKCYIDKEGKLKIVIRKVGLRAFKDLCHEFAHYVSIYYSNKSGKLSISEFPSILFEILSLVFLKSKGYDESIIYYIRKERMENDINIMECIYQIMNDMNNLYKKGSGIVEIKRNEIQDLYIKMYQQLENNPKLKEKVLSKLSNDSLENFLEKVSKDLVEEKCDTSIMRIIAQPTIILDNYPYLLGEFLAKETLNKFLEDFSVIDNVYEIVRNLNNENLKSVLEILDLQDTLHTTKSR